MASDGVKIFTRSCLLFPFRLSKGKAEGAQWRGCLPAEAEKEQQIINANKQLIEIMEQKISDVLSEI